MTLAFSSPTCFPTFKSSPSHLSFSSRAVQPPSIRSTPVHCASSRFCMIEKLTGNGVNAPLGFKAAGHTAGFKPSGQPDLALVVTEDHVAVPTASVFTTNLVRAAPVLVSEDNLRKSGGRMAAVLLNAGQANAATGDAGMQDAVQSVDALATALGVAPHEVFVCSTGVIGRRIDMSKMFGALPDLVAGAAGGPVHGADAALAITTTDLRPKEVAYAADIDGVRVTVGGMCKGSGMIHPNMATMLGVVTCDAAVDPDLWQQMLRRAVDRSFNAITVDGDTSTNDVVVALASGKSGARVDQAQSDSGRQLEDLLTQTCQYLAKSVARDGEGATVLLEVRASGAASEQDAMKLAKVVASSSLVKSAVFGRDPNWGRIAAAAGRSGAEFDQSCLRICIGEHVLMENGTPLDYDEKAASKYMQSKAEAADNEYLSEKDTVVISLQVGDGPGSATAWGCDLSYKYVEINAEYTT